MVTRGNAAYAGLFLEKPDTFDIDYAISAALSALERHDNASGSPLRRSTRRPAVMADTLGISVQAPEEAGAPALVKIITRGGPLPDDDRIPLILAETVLSLLDTTKVAEIEWFSPSSRIAPRDFISLHGHLSPRRQPVMPVDCDTGETSESGANTQSRGAAAQPRDRSRRAGVPALARAVQRLRGKTAEQSPSERRLRLAAWVITGLMAVMSVPLAASLAIIGVLRGMDFRLATLVLTFCVILTGLQQTPMASAMPGVVTVLLN